MTNLIAKSRITAIVGLGVTGLSVARYLAKKGESFVMIDSRENPPGLAEFQQRFPGVPVELGALKQDTLLACSEMVVSPGVALSTPEIATARAAGIPAIGDIELFAREAKARQIPIVAITGSNAKSTVTTLLGEMAAEAGIKVGVGGNIGTPALDLLERNCELYVLELSSFQLETTEKLGAKVATILNISADHMDRYAGLPQYHMAKQRVYFGAEKVVINRLDPLTRPPLAEGVEQLSFGLNQPDFKQYGIRTKADGDYLAYQFDDLLPVVELKIKGTHNVENALAALALGDAVGLPREPMLSALKKFSGLAHRCQWLASIAGVDYYNDSKGTNVGATLAALEGLSHISGKLVLIAGGVGKGADFSALTETIERCCRAIVLIGEDADKIAAVMPRNITVVKADSMLSAVQQSKDIAQQGDVVLLSPACASFDMFSGFEARGDAFAEAVKSIQGGR